MDRFAELLEKAHNEGLTDIVWGGPIEVHEIDITDGEDVVSDGITPIKA